MGKEHLKEYWKNTLVKLKGKIKKKEFVGFDIETYGETNKFMSGGIYYYYHGIEKFEYFTNQQEMLKFLLCRKFRNKMIVATNLGFDLTSLFWKTKYWNKIKLISRGSDILSASYDLGNNHGKIHFIDTFNYARFSVNDLGKILGVPKLEKPDWLGERKPNNKQEEQELKMYNKRDCKITCDFMYYLQEGINQAGGNLKITIASTSLDVWRRGHLNMNLTKESYILKDDKINELIFGAYYGGRTEVFKRGLFKDVNYYDVNSLYPSVMRKKFPVPHSVKKVYNPDIHYVLNYEGVTECEVKSPPLNIPLLPIKIKGKLIFPVGKFKGTWNNVELRKALQLGYTINPINQIIYTETFYPFKSYVDKFYEMRLKAKKDGNNMELIYKLLLNSLYGKFAQKNRQNLIIKMIENITNDEFIKYAKCPDKNPSFILKDGIIMDIQKSIFNGNFSFPILSSYTTSYARLLMYDYLQKYDVIYMDTDSIVIKEEIKNTGKELGMMKHEGKISEAIFIKPKMYLMDKSVKVKGINKCNKKDFETILRGGSVKKIKFSKLRESIRRGFNPNTKISINKTLNLEDNKRLWSERFCEESEQNSVPLELDVIDKQNVLLNMDVPVFYDNRIDDVNAYLKSNIYLKKFFKGRLKELKEGMNKILCNNIDLDLIDWLSMSKDKPINEYVNSILRGEEI